MAKIVGIRGGYSRTFNLGQYNSMKIELDAEAVLDEGEDAAAALDDLLDLLAQRVKAKAMPVLRGNVEEIRQIVAGLPPEVRAQLIGAEE